METGPESVGLPAAELGSGGESPSVTAPVDIAHLRSWIGREEEATETVTLDVVRRFLATLGLPPGDLAPGSPAPRLIHLCLAQPAPATADLGPDGHPARGGFLPPVPLPRRMWAAGEMRFRGDIAIGDAVRRVSRIAEVRFKDGRTGPLCFVTLQHRLEAGGDVAVEERQDIVYRDRDPGGTCVEPPAPAPAGTSRRSVDPSAPLLFRYSALTFNGHRIHYDRTYATKVEGYPGLVVHGPLQATLLYNFASMLRGSPGERFAFRSLSPLFDTEPVVLNAADDGEKVRLWTARPSGPVAMSAEVSW